jgi:hypothetical protein
MTAMKAEHTRDPGLLVGRAVTGAIAAVVVAAAISEASIALGIVDIHASDYGWNVRGLLLVGASCALFFGGPVLAVAAFTRLANGFRAGVPAVAVATGALLVARYYAYDPYYLPSRQRFAEASSFPVWWIALLAALALGTAVLSRRDLRTGLLLAGIVMFLAGPTVFLIGLGH